MKYFTPRLFEQTNSPDFESAYRASLEWQAQGQKYLNSLSRWIDVAPKNIRRLADEFHGHDGQIIGQTLIGTSFFSLFVLTEFDLWQLNYRIVAEPSSTAPITSPVCWCHESIKCWLYDELSRLPDGNYRHQILKDDGSVLQIDFSDVQLHASPRGKRYEFKLELPLTTRAQRKLFPRSEISEIHPRPRRSRPEREKVESPLPRHIQLRKKTPNAGVK